MTTDWRVFTRNNTTIIGNRFAIDNKFVSQDCKILDLLIKICLSFK